jgi:hypothetical protein
MRLEDLYKKVQKLMEEGYGDAVLVHTDSRSGVTERTHMSSTAEIVNGEEYDFYVDLDTGDEYISFYEGD